jgi:hypothetical protein
MAPGGSQKAHVQHFWALAAKWLQEAPRKLILSIFGPWPPNGPRRLPELILSSFWWRPQPTTANGGPPVTTVDSDLIPRVPGSRQNSMVTGVFGPDSTVNFNTFRVRSDSTVYFVNCPTVRDKSAWRRELSISNLWRERLKAKSTRILAELRGNGCFRNRQYGEF